MSESEGRGVADSVVSARRVREDRGRVTIPIPNHETCDQPVIELVREGEVVRAIDVTCPCGRRLRILCDYSEPA